MREAALLSRTFEPDPERMMADLAVFARRVKLSGSEDELASFRYLEGRMREIGFRTQLLSHDAYVSLPEAARVDVNDKELDCITHSMSMPTGPKGIEGRLVDVGPGAPGDFAGRDLVGCILLVDGIATEEVAALATIAGAAGQLHVSPNEQLYEMCVSPVWGNPSQHTRADLPRTAICTISNADGARLATRCRNGEALQVRIVAEVDTGWRKTPLLVAELSPVEGAEDAPFVLFSGHHDTWHFGVMDNGGANATMLEAARLLAGQRAGWERGLRLCFWSGHSHGRYSGSAWYADTFFDELDRRCAAHVNVDSTGAAGAVIVANSAVCDELRHLANDATLAVCEVPHAGRRHGRAADQSFWGIGVPSIFGSVSHQAKSLGPTLPALGWWWHTPHDTIEHIDPDHLARDTRIVLHVLWRLLTDPVLPYDYATFARSLDAELETLESRLDGRFDLSLLRDATRRLEDAAGRIETRRSDAPAEAVRAELNAGLMRASRHLMPLNYTHGDRFRHDPALPHAPWPSLNGLRELAGLPHGSPDEPFFAVHARQTRNRVHHALREAVAALEAVLRDDPSISLKGAAACA